MAWTGQIFSVGQILTAAQMNNLQNDITALADNDSGAPDVSFAAILSGVVGISVGDIGTVALLVRTSASSSVVAGSTYAGSGLKYYGVTMTSITATSGASSVAAGAVVSGTWRALGNCPVVSGRFPCTVFLRIS